MRQAFIVGIGESVKGFRLGRSLDHLLLDALELALADAGLSKADVDGISAHWTAPGGTRIHPGSADWAAALGMRISWAGGSSPQGPLGVADAAAAICAGLCNVAVVMNGQGTDGLRPASTVERRDDEFVTPFGLFTPVHYALLAQRYLHDLGPGTASEVRLDVAAIAASVRSMGSADPNALLAGRGLISAEDVLASPMIASPLRKLDICLNNDGAVAVIVAESGVAANTRSPIRVLGAGAEFVNPPYVRAPRLSECWTVGAAGSRRALSMAGLRPDDLDVRAFYDPNAFEIARQFEMLGYCDFGEGAAFAASNGLGPTDRMPTNTDGGLLAYSAIGEGGPQGRIVYAVRQLRGEAGPGQVPDAKTAIACAAGSGTQQHHSIVLGRP